MKKFCVLLSFVCLILFLPLTGCGEKAEKQISEYEITCTLDENVLSGSEKVRFFNDSITTFNELKFNLFSNAYRKGAKRSPVGEEYRYLAYPDGESYGGIEILSVKGESELSYSVGGDDLNVLTVKLAEEVFPGESVTVVIDYRITIANVIARLGINDKTVNLAEFYPILCAKDKDGFYECVYYDLGDPYFSECADYTVNFTADEKYAVAHAGKKVYAKNQDGKANYKFRLENARSFSMVLSESFESVSGKAGDTVVNYFYYDDETPNESMEYAIKSLKTFSELFGDYAYGEYTVVQTPFIQGGMEFPTLVMISDSVEKRAYGEVIVHETAHQWWQTAVGNNEIEHAFLDEGLAEYSTVLFYENNPEYNFTRSALMQISNDTYKSFCSVADKLLGGKNTSMERSLKDFSTEYEYVNIVYVKGCIVFDEIRKCVGEKAFFEGLKNYYSENKYKVATPLDLVSAFAKAGLASEDLINAFIGGTAIM
ncbi:MAG: M1 family metallopeptidase [Clostridia bacterium]|nr:M1 family metallopeptidase [Clostridia bacterium]